MMQALVSSVVDAKKASTAQCCRALGVSRSGLYAMASKAKRFQGGVRGIRNTSRVFKFDLEWSCAKIVDPGKCQGIGWLGHPIAQRMHIPAVCRK